jgi:GNAT superfamily N-acetyltransferase
MRGLVFDVQSPVFPSDPNRADIACFVGFVARRASTPVPAELRQWLIEQGWWEDPDPLRPGERRRPYARDSARQLLDVPVPIDTWETFDRLFAWEERRLDPARHEGVTYLGAAVRSFFAQGGRKCYVVRLGDPWRLTVVRRRRLARVARMIPGYPTRIDAVPADRSTWSGVGHLLGLPDVSMVCLPDLCDAVGVDGRRPRAVDEPPPLDERFVECSSDEPATPVDRTRARLFPAPRCDQQAYLDWAAALNLVVRLVRDSRPRLDVQVIAAVPIPEDGSVIAADLRRFLTDRNHGLLTADPAASRTGLASAFLQLAYPWARTEGSARLPEGIESPEGVVAGLLARNALSRGAYRSAAALPLADVYDAVPALTSDQLATVAHRTDVAGRPLHERISVLANTPGGLELISDVTTSASESYRPASVNRLVMLLIRAARRLGDDATFEPAGERVWDDLRDRLSAMLLGLLSAGALRGSSASEAFSVRCDRSTMTQNDIDNGRTVAEIFFSPTAPVEQIRLVLSLDEGGQVQFASTSQRDAA